RWRAVGCDLSGTLSYPTLHRCIGVDDDVAAAWLHATTDRLTSRQFPFLVLGHHLCDDPERFSRGLFCRFAYPSSGGWALRCGGSCERRWPVECFFSPHAAAVHARHCRQLVAGFCTVYRGVW